MKDDGIYIRHILDAIGKIEEYVRGLDHDVFVENMLVQDGVMREIEIIGEAARNLSPAYKEKIPSIPWRDVIGMRNKLIHEYFEVDLDAVWKTVQEDLPFLKKKITE
ncbi:DUF86 domain-containing protein [bacterium]|nr:DUF86 domain-containing protein [bacterium]